MFIAGIQLVFGLAAGLALLWLLVIVVTIGWLLLKEICQGIGNSAYWLREGIWTQEWLPEGFWTRGNIWRKAPR